METIYRPELKPASNHDRFVHHPQQDWISPGHPPTTAPNFQDSTLHIGSSAAIKRIQQDYLRRVIEVRQACQAAVLSHAPQAVIEKVIDLVGLDECMVHAMARATGEVAETFNDQRLLRRCDIDALLTSAANVGDRQVQMLGEILLKNQQRYQAALLESTGQRFLFGF